MPRLAVSVGNVEEVEVEARLVPAVPVGVVDADFESADVFELVPELPLAGLDVGLAVSSAAVVEDLPADVEDAGGTAIVGSAAPTPVEVRIPVRRLPILSLVTQVPATLFVIS
jgi:hypothetical protein